MRAQRAMRLVGALLAAGLSVAGARHAKATYSVVGVDTATRQVGGAGTSCLGGFDVHIIYGSVPGRGVVHAQALFSATTRDRAVELLAGGTAPADVIAAITHAEYDGSATLRQYAIADLEGRVAAHTGAGAQSYAGDRQGRFGSFTYSVQGNILTAEAVLTQAATAFEGGGCDLAERLLRALEAGALGGHGDSRCTPNGIPSDSAFVQVDREGEAAGSYLALRVPSSGRDNPLVELRAQFAAWRETHPCPTPAGGGDAGNAGATGMAPLAPAEDGCTCGTAPRRSGEALGLCGFLALGLAVYRRRLSSTFRGPRSRSFVRFD